MKRPAAQTVKGTADVPSAPAKPLWFPAALRGAPTPSAGQPRPSIRVDDAK